MPRLRLLLEYDGASLWGWQHQRERPTVEGHLRAALHKITQEPEDSFDFRVAGRTDRGVHALAQVATFETTSMREPRRFAPALNHMLPPEIRVLCCDAAPEGFCPRQSSLAKTYRYTILSAAHPSPLLRGRAWQLRRRLDVDAMQRAAQSLVGHHDFDSFRSVHCDASHARRTMHQIEVCAVPRGPIGTQIEVVLRANAFCRHMCRIIVGTLVEVGAGMRRAQAVEEILHARDRTKAGETAPGEGLTLVRVEYPAECDPWPAISLP